LRRTIINAANAEESMMERIFILDLTAEFVSVSNAGWTVRLKNGTQDLLIMTKRNKKSMIQITEDIGIRADRRCFSLCFRRQKKGKEVWEAESYFSDLDHLFRKLINLAVVAGVNEGSWEAVSKDNAEMKAAISEKLDQILSISPRQTRSEAGEKVLLKNAGSGIYGKFNPPDQLKNGRRPNAALPQIGSR
jgi:hypothetical protein